MLSQQDFPICGKTFLPFLYCPVLFPRVALHPSSPHSNKGVSPVLTRQHQEDKKQWNKSTDELLKFRVVIEGSDLETVRCGGVGNLWRCAAASIELLIVHLLGPSFPSLSTKFVVNRNKQIKSQYDGGMERLAACGGISKHLFKSHQFGVFPDLFVEE